MSSIIAVLAQHDLGLGQVEVDGAAPPAPIVQHREQVVHQLEQRHQRLVLRTHAPDRGPSTMAFTAV